MTPEQLEALKAILDYIEADEARHYEECPPELRDRHVYNDILVLRRFLEENLQ